MSNLKSLQRMNVMWTESTAFFSKGLAIHKTTWVSKHILMKDSYDGVMKVYFRRNEHSFQRTFIESLFRQDTSSIVQIFERVETTLQNTAFSDSLASRLVILLVIHFHDLTIFKEITIMQINAHLWLVYTCGISSILFIRTKRNRCTFNQVCTAPFVPSS